MVDLTAIDVEELASALADQTDYDLRWLIDPRSGEIVFWTSDTGIDGVTCGASARWARATSMVSPNRRQITGSRSADLSEVGRAKDQTWIF